MTKTITVHLSCGLGNCLRVIATAMWYCKLTGRKFKLAGDKFGNYHYDYKIDKMLDLEQMGIELVNEEQNHATVFQEKDFPLFDYFNCDATKLFECDAQHITLFGNRALCLPSDYRATIDGEQRYMKIRREMYALFVWKQELKDAFENFMNTSASVQEDYIGIHIRRDDLYMYQAAAQNFNLEHYMNRAAEYKSDTSNWVLCTDDKKLRTQWKDKIMEINIPEEFKANSFGALFDFLLLTRAKYIVGTFTSSFSFEAYLFGTTPLEYSCIGDRGIHTLEVPFLHWQLKNEESNLHSIGFWVLVGILLILVKLVYFSFNNWSKMVKIMSGIGLGLLCLTLLTCLLTLPISYSYQKFGNLPTKLSRRI
jgi:hypothetical protein